MAFTLTFGVGIGLEEWMFGIEYGYPRAPDVGTKRGTLKMVSAL